MWHVQYWGCESKNEIVVKGFFSLNVNYDRTTVSYMKHKVLQLRAQKHVSLEPVNGAN